MFSSVGKKRIALLALVLVCLVAIAILRPGEVSNAISNQNAALLPVLGAAMVDSITTDVDGDGRADPGDTLQYTVTINNTGTDSLNTVFTDTISANTTLVPGSVNSSPIAFDDPSYTAAGNVRITIPAASGVLANDIDPDTGTNSGLTASSGATSAQGGNVAMSANGGFSYNPPPGFTGTDTFTYTVTDAGGATGTGTVTFNVAGMIWFINAAAGGGGDGRLTSPFNCYTGAGCFSAVAADDPGDNIFLYSGAYTGGNPLLANQRLIGQGAGASLSTITGITPPAGSDSLPATAGTRPTITTGAGTSGVLLGTGNTLRGFNIGNTGTTDITGTNFGTLTVQDIELNGTGRLVDLATGTVAATFDNLTSANGPGGQAVNLNGVGGALTVTGTTSITTPGGQGINIAGSSVAASFGTSTTITDPATQGILVGTSTGNVSFGNTTISDATDAISLQNNSAGTRSFGTITVTNGSGDSFLHGVGGGTTTVSGLATLTNPASNCIDIQDSTTAVTFANVNCTQSAAAGVFLDDNSGNVTFADLDIDTDTNVRGIHVTEPHSGTITTTSGTIADTGTATAVEIVGTSAASRTPLNMQLTNVSSSGAVSGIVLTNTSSSGSPGGFRVLGNSAGLCGGSVSSGPPASAASVTAPVTGDCTGGTIQNSTGPGIVLNNAANIVLTRMQIVGSGDDGVRGTNVTDFSLISSFFNNNGNAINECGIDFGDTSSVTPDGLHGTGAITNSTIQNSYYNGASFRNSGGTALTSFTVSGSQFRSLPTNGDSNDNLFVEAGGTASMALSVSGSHFSSIEGDHIQAAALNSGTLSNVAITNNTLTGGHTTALGQGITINAATGVALGGWTGRIDYDVNGNNIQGAVSNGVSVVLGTSGAAGTFDGFVRNNIIGTSGVSLSCSTQANGIYIDKRGNGTQNSSVTGNTVRQCFDRAILTEAGDGSGVLNLTVQSNTLDQQVDAGAREAIQTNFGITSTNVFGVQDAPAVCLQLGGAGGLGNTFSNGGGAPDDFRLRKRFGATVRLPGYAGGTDQTAGSLAQVVAFIEGQNTDTPPNSASASGSGGGYTGGAACTLPTFAPAGQEEMSIIFDVYGNESLSGTDLMALFVGTTMPANSSKPSSNAATMSDEHVALTDTLPALSSGSTPAEGGLVTIAGEFADKIMEMISPTVYSQEIEKVRREDGIKDPEITPESPVSGETITVNGGSINGFTLPAGKSITITFRASINTGVLPAFIQVSNQGTVSATGIANVLTDDPDVAGTANPTVTNIDHTTVALASNANPSVFGQNVTFTATMTGVPSRASDPPGTVQFKADGVNIGSPVAVVVGTANDNVSTAQASISSLAIGNRVITAEYSGGGSGVTGYNANTGTPSGGQLVGQANTTVGIVSNANPSVSGQSVTFTATVSVTSPGSGSPTGNISFRDNGTNIGTCAAQTVTANVATCSISTLSVSTHPITAVYNGDGNFSASPPSTAVSQVVNRANTSVALTSSQNPAPLGTNITFTAAISITSPGAGTTSGTVQFRDGATPITGCSAITVAMNSAACSTTALTAGNHTISAIYSGDTNFNTSTGNLTGNPQVITGPPVLVPAVGLSRVKSAPATNSQIGTVSDDVSSPGSIAVTVQSAPMGISVTNIVNNNGTITADIAAGCAAATGTATVVLNAADGKGLSQNANLSINILANPAPTLGTYANQNVVSSCKLFITPTAAPNDNVPLTSVTVASGTFGGTLSVDQTTGVVTASNANPVPGPHTVIVTATDSCGVQATSNFTITVAPTPTAPKDFDFDGDRKADISIYRAGATANAVSTWFILRSSDSTVRINQFGNGEDRIAPADYTGDGTFDLAVFRPSTSTWYYSSDQINPGQNFSVLKWGATGDIPVPGRFDADNKTDIAIWRPSTGQWWIAKSTGGTDVRVWGTNGDKPIAADVDGDGTSDLIQYRSSNFSFYALKSGGGNSITPFGIAGDRLIPADYDGDGIDDLAVYRPSTNQWWIQQSTGGLRLEVWGQSGDVPAPADYDNDGKVDLAIFRPADGTWWIFSSCPCVLTGSQFGIGTDIAVPSVITP